MSFLVDGLKRFFFAIPCYIIMGIVSLDVYNYVNVFILQSSSDYVIPVILCTILFTLDIVLLVWSYGRTIFTSNSTIDNPAPADYMLEWLKDHAGQQHRVCPKCANGQPKPYRCHHCSICDSCQLRMDHHCPVSYLGLSLASLSMSREDMRVMIHC